MSKFSEWQKARARKSELEKQVEANAVKFNTAINLADGAARKLPGTEAREGAAKVLELRESFKNARLGKDLEAKTRELARLVQEAEQMALTLSTPVQTRARSSNQPPPRPQSTADAIRKLVGDVDTIRQAIVSAGLPVPALLSKLIADGNRAADPNGAVPDDAARATRQGLTEVEEEKATFLGFIAAWQNADTAETQNRLALPAAPALFKPLESTWTNDLGLVKSDFGKVATIAEVDAPLQRLESIQTRLSRKRKELTEQHAATDTRVKEIEARIADVGRMATYDLTEPRRLLVQARNEFTTADGPDKLTAAMRTLQSADIAIKSAQTSLGKPETEALAKFAKRRRVLADQLAAAGLVRGALEPGSEVAKAIAGVDLLLKAADASLAQAKTVAQMTAATDKLEEAIAKNVDKSADKLGKALKQKAESDLAALPEYNRLFTQLTTVRNAVAQIPGGHVELQKADALVALTRVNSDGQPKDGFAAALTLLKQSGIEQIRTRAQKTSGEFEQSLKPAAATALQAAKDAMVTYGLCHTPFQVDAQQRAMATASQLPDPVAALDTLAESLKQATAAQQQARKDLRLRVEAITRRLNELKAAGMPEKSPDMLELARQLAAAEELRVESRLDEARTRLDTLDDLSTQAKTAYDLAKTQWTNTKASLDAPLLRAQALSDAPGSVGTVARDIVHQIGLLMTDQANGSVDLREAAAAAKTLVTRAGLLETSALAANFAANFDMGAFKTESDKLMVAWNTAADEVRQDMAALELALKEQGVKGGIASTTFAAQLTDLQQRRGALAFGIPANSGETPTQALTRIHTTLLRELNLLRFNLPSASAPTAQGFKDTVEAGKRNELVAACRQAWQVADRMLSELKSASGDAQAELQKSLGPFDPATASAKRIEELGLLGKKFALLVQSRREETKKEKAPTKKEGEKLKDELGKKLLSRQSVTFRGLFDDLGRRVDDALAMLETDDAVLIAAAKRQIAEIRLTLDDAKGNNKEGGATLEMVQDTWAELSHTLGDDAIVQRRLPDTYSKLKSQLDSAIEAARRLPPEEGLAGLVRLREPMNQARALAQQTQVRYDGFKLRRKYLEEQFDKMKDHTGATLLGGRAKAFNERFASRLADAHALARQEGQLDAANKEIETMTAEMTGLLALQPDAAREKLQGLNVEAEGEQRELRDLARNWDNTQDYWQDKLLPEVEKAVARRKEDDTEVESLKAAIASIGKTLAPYLAVVSMVPHKRLGSNGAPDMKAARAAFAQAYVRVAQLSKAAARLRDGTGSTNVDLESDLNKLEKEWVRRATDARNTLSQLADSFMRLPQQASDNTGEANFLSVQDKTALINSVDQVRPLLEKLSSRFPDSAFSAPFAVLRGQTSPAERKKAREEALRTVRQISAEIDRNPLFLELYNGAAADMLDVDPRPPISFLRASLKKVELAALVGI